MDVTNCCRYSKVNSSLDTCALLCGSRGPVIAEMETENGVKHLLFPRAKVNFPTGVRERALINKVEPRTRIVKWEVINKLTVNMLQAAYVYLSSFLAEAYRPQWPGSWDINHSQAEAVLSSASELENISTCLVNDSV